MDMGFWWVASCVATSFVTLAALGLLLIVVSAIAIVAAKLFDRHKRIVYISSLSDVDRTRLSDWEGRGGTWTSFREIESYQRKVQK